MSYSNGEDKVLRRWHVYLALTAILLASGKVIWSAGGTDARTEEQLSTIRVDVSQIKQDFARKDVLEPRLANMEKSLTKSEEAIKEQNRLLGELLVEAKQRNSKRN